jgi:hypothetical protein
VSHKKGESMERPQSQNERSLAWFKLADLIARGEREKALSVFRLLSHSFADKAYILQVEGDILWFMDSTASIEKYKQAAFLYQKEKRFVDAVAVQEHVLAMKPDASESLAILLVLYALLDWPEKFTNRLILLGNLYKEKKIDILQLEKSLLLLTQALELQAKKPWLATCLQSNQGLLPAGTIQKLQTLF